MMRRCYEFVDADLTPIASSDAHSEADETQAPVLNIILTGCQRKVFVLIAISNEKSYTIRFASKSTPVEIK